MGLLKYLIGYAALELIYTDGKKRSAAVYANSVPGHKLNIGAAGKGQPVFSTISLDSGEKCDICPDYLNNINYCNLNYTLPYRDRQFGVVFASHVLEHVEPEYIYGALQEMARVGNEVVIVIPHPLIQSMYTVSSHKSLIYRNEDPINGLSLYVRNNPLYNNRYFANRYMLNSNVFRVYQ